MKKIKSMFEKHNLVKIVCLAILVTIILSWIIPYGYFSSGELTSYGLKRQGLTDILLSGVYSANFFLQQLLFVVFIGVFYSIVTKISGYKVLVNGLAKKFQGKEKLFVLLSSLVITLLTTFLTQTYIVLFFVPFIINIATKLKLDKITAYLATFGSILVGILGATYGTEGLVYFINYLNYYTTVDVTLEIGIRFGILALAFIIFNFFTIRRMNKLAKSKKNEDKLEDVFEVEEDSKKKVKVWPMALFFLIIFAFAILGYVNWNGNFGITVFDKFHTWLKDLSVGDYNIISYILGENAVALGTWDLYIFTVVLTVVLLLSMLIYKVKFDDVVEYVKEGLKKILAPLGVIFLIYTIFVFIYWSPFTVTISNWILKMADGFNPFLTTISAVITSIFHIDFGYTGYVIGDFMVNYFGDSFNIAYVIYITINGLVQFIAPTSIMAMFGLAYLNIPYKKWLKHIWKFFVIMLVVLLIIFSLLTYL